MRNTRGIFLSVIGAALAAGAMAVSASPAQAGTPTNMSWTVSNNQVGATNVTYSYSFRTATAGTITGSITAFLIGQLIDVAVFHRIRMATGERWVWLRATGSTAVSQLIDSFVVLYIAFVIGPQHWPIPLFLAVGTVNYGYKLLMAFLLIPLIYLTRRVIRAYLGAPAATALEEAARNV